MAEVRRARDWLGYISKTSLFAYKTIRRHNPEDHEKNMTKF
jgi:hypothetical protein